MPTISLTQLAKYAFTVTVIILLTALIISYVSSFVEVLSSLFSKISGFGSDVNGLNLGWFANAIGLVDFLNSLMISFYVAGSFFVSSLVTLLGMKFLMKFYTSFTRV